MIKGIAFLLLCQLVGEVAVRGLGLPLPGPVVGFLLLFAFLLALAPRTYARPRLGRLVEEVGSTSDRLLASLGLLFVPAGAGVIQNLGVFAAHGVGLALTLVLSLAVTLVVTVLVFVAVTRLTSRRTDAGETEGGDERR
ncbi:CidA/LrgA family protein [Methylobrevis pamukkalensis]|uniref:Antiholin-like protein LrgA n=1 Tax=Methylobrevis pamukkalensis TaxID=1439726 RepID=A0A1E3H1Q8_9HYPH|nr:CidA/LrgA family protein [Methylobrevis pamukkalensis]ODN70247.1 Antiholin-like protein LrgA [Methylobrevis pamukkalensis]